MFKNFKKQVLLLLLLALILTITACQNKSEVIPPENNEGNEDVEGKEEDNDKLTTELLKGKLDNPDWVVVDTRINDAFNGWALDGIKRGGRIKGAVDFSANWLTVKVDNKEKRLDDALELKGITPEKEVILYDANGKDAPKVKEFLEGKGFKKIHLYDVKEWANDETLPMESYPNYQRIIPADILKEIVDGNKPETFQDAKDIKIVEVSWGDEKTSYAKGHIPGAVHINTDTIEPPPEWMLASDAKLEKFALDYGFTKDDTVIVTGEATMASYRVASVLDYIGVADVRILNGGHNAWTTAGYKLETKSHKPTPVKDFGKPIPGNPDVIVGIEGAKKAAQDENSILVDNRTWDEHIGKSSGYSYHDKKGRIPGSVFGYAGLSDANSLEYYRNLDDTMRNGNEIIEMWKKAGIDPKKHLTLYCGSGWRVAEIYYFADVLGIDNKDIYSDGWIGWSNGGNPSETGEPKK